MLAATLERQRKAVLSKLGAGSPPAEALDLERWNRELGADLFGLALAMAPEVAEPVAGAFGIEFDLPRASAWLRRNADITADRFNRRTLEHLGDAYAAVQADHETGKPDARARSKSTRQALRDAGVGVFDTADGRADFLARERAAIIESYSRNEAAQQAGARSKRWVTPHPKPRPSHGALDGVEVVFNQAFPNGAKYPRDPKLSVGERAGCTCYVDYGTNDVDRDKLAEARRSIPGNFKSTDDFRAWARRNGLEVSDEFDAYDLDVDFLNGLATRVDDIVNRYPALRPREVGLANGEAYERFSGFRGFRGLESTPQEVTGRAFTGEAWGATWRIPTGIGQDSGSWITVDLSRVGTNAFLNPSNPTLALSDLDAMVHELGHVVSHYLQDIVPGRFGSSRAAVAAFKTAAGRVWGSDLTNVGIIKDLGLYAGRNVDELFAEAFLAAYEPTVYARLTPTAQSHLRRLAREFNELAGADVFPVP